MWCAQCRADVAAEVTADNRRIRCAICGTHLETPPGQRLSERSREARQLLERWSAEPAFDPYAPLTTARPLAELTLPDTPSADEPLPSSSSPAAETRATSDGRPSRAAASRPAGRRSFRVDTSHRDELPTETAETASGDDAPSDAPASADVREETVREGRVRVPRPSAAAGRRNAPDAEVFLAEPATEPESLADTTSSDDESASDAVKTPRSGRRRKERRIDPTTASSRPRAAAGGTSAVGSHDPQRALRIDAAHDPQEEGPHFDVQTLVQRAGPRKPNSTSIAGQFLAYAGVLGLTVGTAMVVWGYFGGPANFTPTGWLITTAGQMLLFLGVVTLVSGGMEQTTDEVSRRIDWLGERLIRIEQSSRDHALRGPSIPAERFAEEAQRTAAEPRVASRTE